LPRRGTFRCGTARAAKANNHSTKFIGLDVHNTSISQAIAEDGIDKVVRLYGTIKNTTEALDKGIRQLVST
jgi:hypothetical protein